MVGLPDIAVKESRERIQAALKNCGFDFPSSRRHRQSGARRHSQGRLGIRSAHGALDSSAARARFFGKLLDPYIFLGELSLDGSVRSVRGALSAALAAREHGIKNVVVPEANAREAAVVEGIRVFAVNRCRKPWT